MRIEVLQRARVRIVSAWIRLPVLTDALGLVTACVENDAPRLLLTSRSLPAAFFDLHSKFAGEFLQKLENYRIRFAGVFPQEQEYGERFSEFLSEAKRGRSFRAFTNRSDAEAWLASE
jgi:hypothetical protein